MSFLYSLLQKYGSDRIATLFGLLAGASQLNGFSLAGALSGNPDDIFKLGGAAALIVLGLVTNKTPTSKSLPSSSEDSFTDQISADIESLNSKEDSSSNPKKLTNLPDLHSGNEYLDPRHRELTPSEREFIKKANERINKSLEALTPLPPSPSEEIKKKEQEKK